MRINNFRFYCRGIKEIFNGLSFLLFILIIISSSAAGQPQSSEVQISNSSDNSNGAYYSGIYRNIFTEVLGLEKEKVEQRIDSAFNKLFYGEDKSERIYYPVEPGMAYIEDILHKDVRSEGMSYGMMIAVQLNKKEEFDRLWKWAKTHMQLGSGYFAWQLKSNGEILDSTSASDGEEWIVMSLFFASGRWGDGEGIFNYKSEAQAILDAMLGKKYSKENKDMPDGTLTNMFDLREKQIVFVPEVQASHFTDPSYHLPHYYQLWAKWSDKNNQFWYNAADASRLFLKKAANPNTGLYPDYANFDGTAFNPWGGGNNNFQYDAWRVAMNLAADYSWFKTDEWAVDQSNRLLNFFHSQGINNYGNLYKLTGEKLSNDRSTGLVAMNAAASLAASTSIKNEFVKELWNSPIPKGEYRYYDAVLYMLAFLQLSGNFRIYAPDDSFITEIKEKGYFTLAEPGKNVPLIVSTNDYPGVMRVAKHLQNDIGKVTGVKPELSYDKIPSSGEIVIVGTVGKSPLIDELVQNKKISIDDLQGKWEKYNIQVVENPFPGISRALVIAGSDKRGAIYGMYEISSEIGVSSWYWWADVPIKRKSNIYVKPGIYSAGEPKVKYRGIFINDEAPALAGWAHEKFGGFNSKFYENVFELILRMKGNFLWPAMWGRAFYDDDSLSPKLADEYGVVISTSHHEPMMRAHVEWERYGSGPWNYETNSGKLREFWKEGIERMGTNESIVTLAMRGDGDEAMSPTANIALLENIVKDQREIIEQVTGKDVRKVPQVWALYKEVQEYYDKGMRVPDDVTILLCDDNWGNIRKLIPPGKEKNAGGYGIYYHYDYVGGPRNYKWLNTNQIERVWEQMRLAYEYGANKIWIVNVGDIKPMEFPIEFFLDYAWNPNNISAGSIPEYYVNWSGSQFGKEFAKDIAAILADYTKFNSRRKPEMLSPQTYSLTDFREAETVVEDYKQLEYKARKIYNLLSDEYKKAFYQLVLHPVEACANLNELYVTAGKNYLYAEQGRAATNGLALKVQELFAKDSLITDYYNNKLAGGKWNHMMDQTHIGYTNWQQPDKNSMPPVKEIELGEDAELGVAVEGSEKWWQEGSEAKLPVFDSFNKQSYWLEIFNRGQKEYTCKVLPAENWIKVSEREITVDKEKRIWVDIDWEKAPLGNHQGEIKITGPDNSSITITAVINNVQAKTNAAGSFTESNGFVSIDADHYYSQSSAGELGWLRIPNLGRTGSAMTGNPVITPSEVKLQNSPQLEYKVNLTTEGEVTVKVYISPTLNFLKNEGLRYAISIDDEEAQIVNIHKDDTAPDWKYPQYWNQAVSNNIRIYSTKHLIKVAGEHTLKLKMIDPAVVFQKIVIETGEVNPSYLGPPESFNDFIKIRREKGDGEVASENH